MFPQLVVQKLINGEASQDRVVSKMIADCRVNDPENKMEEIIRETYLTGCRRRKVQR